MAGNLTAEEIYEAVGCALSRWEAMELQLALLYSLFKGSPYRLETVSHYGSGKGGRVFVDRMTRLRLAADEYGIKALNQDFEGDVLAIIRDAKEIAQKRHRIAHGLVQPVTYFEDPETGEDADIAGERRFVLLPPFFSAEQLRKGAPSYAYNADDILIISTGFIALAHRAKLLFDGLVRHNRVSRDLPPASP